MYMCSCECDNQAEGSSSACEPASQFRDAKVNTMSALSAPIKDSALKLGLLMFNSSMWHFCAACHHCRIYWI